MALLCPLEELSLFTRTTCIAPPLPAPAKGFGREVQGSLLGLQIFRSSRRPGDGRQGLNAAPVSLCPDSARGWDLLFPDLPVSLQTVADCVLYYYLTKKNENYKNLVRRNYRRRGKSQVRAGGARGNVVPWAEQGAAALCTCGFSAALSLSTPNAAFLPSPDGDLACRLRWGCGFALCSFSEHAVFWQLMFVRPCAKVTVALKKQTTNPRCLKKGME